MISTKKQNIIFIVISILILVVTIISFTFAFFSANITANGNIIVSANIERTMNPIFTATPSGDLILNITDADMLPSEANNETTPLTADETINVTLLGGTLSDLATCSFDFVWTKLSDSDTYVPSTGRGNLKENTISIVDDNSVTVLAETNIDSFTSGNAIASSSISSHGELNSKEYTITQSFYNLNLNQTMYNASYKSRISIQNISCTLSNYSQLLTSYLVNTAPKSGTDAVSNSPWILTSNHSNEWRYAGKNPDNYIQFNGELWRIIGVMPNMEYCTGEYGTATECDTTSTGSLVKIIRNQLISSTEMPWDYKKTGVGSSISNSGSNDWSDSQLMLMLNGTNYLKTGYDVNGAQLHTSYTITSNIVARNGYNFYNATYSYLDGNGTTVYVPSSATTSGYSLTSQTLYKKIESSALNQIATVKWYLYGTNSYSTSAEGSPAAWYNKEKNIGGIGAVYTNASLPEKRPVYWYGKIGLMYPSDYGYATNGGSTYNRTTCLNYQMSSWHSSGFQTDCAFNSYLLYTNITSTAPETSGTTQFTISPLSGNSDSIFVLYGSGYVGATTAYVVALIRPVLYLKADTLITGGIGTWNAPYTIGTSNKSYWFAADGSHVFPSNGGTLQSSGSATGHGTYIGQDNSQYYSCATFSGRELCLSQPYNKYGLSVHTISSSFTTTQQNNAKQAVYQAFANAGISVDINNCEINSNYVNCGDNSARCGVNLNGSVYCSSSDEVCEVGSNGQAVCLTGL